MRAQILAGERDAQGLLRDPLARAKELLENCRDTTKPDLDGISGLRALLSGDPAHGGVTYEDVESSEEELLTLEQAHRLEEARQLLELCRQGETEHVAKLRSLLGVSFDEIGTTAQELESFGAGARLP